MTILPIHPLRKKLSYMSAAVVRSPGVYELKYRDRIIDAVNMAGMNSGRCGFNKHKYGRAC